MTQKIAFRISTLVPSRHQEAEFVAGRDEQYPDGLWQQQITIGNCSVRAT
jgi:hypothetical protein